jgi:hypothetical protein
MTKVLAMLLLLATAAAVSACTENNTMPCGSLPYHTSCAP